MKKFLLLVVISAFFISCGGGDKAEKIRSQISEKKKQSRDLNSEIDLLTEELRKHSDADSLRYRIPVEVLTMDFGLFNHYFEASGVVEAVNEAFISPELNGQIKELFVKEGDHVSKGQLLAKLNTSITESAISEVETSLELASILYEKQKQLWEKKIGSEIQFLEAKNRVESLESRLETLKSQLDMAYIKSPLNGLVDKIYQKEGELAIPGMQLMRVINLDNIYVNVDVAETYLPDVQPGDNVVLEFPTWPGNSRDVPVYRIGNVINPENRTFNVQLKINNPQHKYKPNMVAVVKINDYSAEDALVVPSLVIKQDLKGHYLYLVKDNAGEMKAVKRYIKPGISYNDKTTVTGGLKAGDNLITAGFNQVSDGSLVKIINE